MLRRKDLVLYGTPALGQRSTFGGELLLPLVQLSSGGLRAKRGCKYYGVFVSATARIDCGTQSFRGQTDLTDR
jgi:hypothetical protein